MNWTAQQKIRLGYWLLTLVPIVLGALAASNAVELNAAARHVAETNRIGKLLEKLFSEIKDVEVAQREYILVGGQQPLQTIRNTRVQIDEDIRELRKLGADPRWLSLLDSLLPQKFDEIQQTIESRNERGLEAASQMLLTNRGHQAMDDIRRVATNMRTEEERRLSERSSEQSRRFQRTFELFAGVLLLNLALIGILYFLQKRETERARQLHEELERRVALRTEALQRSNEDLQQFAYIASHDMKEPLRMIASYTTLLQRRYASKLDADADAFMNFIVDGVHRISSDEHLDSGSSRVLPRRRRQRRQAFGSARCNHPPQRDGEPQSDHSGIRRDREVGELAGIGSVRCYTPNPGVPESHRKRHQISGQSASRCDDPQ
jgi:CHASE3 domain sensor protein